MSATIKDIARETGLGLATISSYLNGGNVREKNRVKIEAAIKDLHYEINEVARAVRTNRSMTIGVVIPELNNTFCAEIITSMEDEFRKKGYATMVCDCRTDKALEKESLAFLYRKRVDGIVNMPVDTSGQNLKIFESAGRPIILIDRKIDNLTCDGIFVDNKNAAKNAILKFLEKGHRKIGIIADPSNIYPARSRLLGYKEALREYGLEPEKRLICYGDCTIRGGIEGFNELYRNCEDMTALFIPNHEMTLGALIAINEKGIPIPKKLSFAGFGNEDFAKAFSPALTLITQPTDKIGKQVAETMLSRLEGTDEEKDRPPHDFCFQTGLFAGRTIAEPENTAV
ncbi:MAG TPA: LacI family DNA-binding transcriptional regulator [Lachnospiraceae bacterium]|nr:LacI family DNA-binding transcriptional regulator [Lachnospiraceae bacterium]